MEPREVFVHPSESAVARPLASGIQMLNHAIETARGGELCAYTGEDRHQLPIRFSPEPVGKEADAFWCHVPDARARLLKQLAEANAVAEISFTTPEAHVFFDTSVVARRRGWFARALLLRRPQLITVVERRQGGGREMIPEELELPAVLRPKSPAGQPAATFRGRVWDISRTGASFLCRSNQPIPTLPQGEGLSAVFHISKARHTLHGTHRYTQRLSAATVRIGMQFDTPIPVDGSACHPLTQFIEDMKGRRMRDTFRKALQKRFHYEPS